MKAIIVQTEKEGRPLLWQEVPDPVCGAEEVLIEVHATALNRADLLQRAGKYPPPPGASEILGLEVAGRIIEMGTAVSGWQIGDQVCALLAGGGYAEKINVHHKMLLPIPNDWSYEQAAAFPEVFFTAFVNLFMEAGLQSGESVLIHGGASGVGTAAIQLAHQAGCRVFITAGTDEKVTSCLQLGADIGINYRKEDFAERVLAETDERGVNVVLDISGADYLKRNLRVLALKGRLVIIGLMSGFKTEINLLPILSKRLRVIGSVLRARPLHEKVAIKDRLQDQFWTPLQEGKIEPIIDAVYPIEQVEAAHNHMAANKNIGKIILKTDR